MKLSNLNEFLQFRRPVRVTFVGLLGFSIAFLLFPSFYPLIFSNSEKNDFLETENVANTIIEKATAQDKTKAYNSFPKNFKSRSYNEEKAGPPKYYPKKKAKGNRFTETELFPFDPNTVNDADLLRLGFSERVARTFLNYRSKGVIFRKKEDFKKVYGISKADYQLLEPFISIQNSTPKFVEKKFKKAVPIENFSKEKPPVAIKIDVNKASEEEWQTLRGIGPYYAKKIVNFREKLGGFSSIEQIGSTYNLKDSTFQNIKPFLEISPIFQKMKINSATWEELKNHPYIRGKQASVIEKYRKNNGAFKDFNDFKKVVVFSKEELERLKPYLDFSIE